MAPGFYAKLTKCFVEWQCNGRDGIRNQIETDGMVRGKDDRTRVSHLPARTTGQTGTCVGTCGAYVAHVSNPVCTQIIFRLGFHRARLGSVFFSCNQMAHKPQDEMVRFHL
ncbi:hypothetical protein RUM43_011099 [Polyplax serrata]|uniref:Uncharacterized protein n=1 Tax=Polyplax serrata TaxID=468196 RepID=A0AAN8PU83_POLSC